MVTVKRVALVTGGNRGLGFETCHQLAKRGLRIVLTSRDAQQGEKAANILRAEGLDVAALVLDVRDVQQVQNVRQVVQEKFGRLDVLINNAGAVFDAEESSGGNSIFKVKVQVIRDSLENNTWGALQINQALIPVMQKHNYGRVVHVSSGMGQLSDMNSGWPGYRLSKVTMNALTRMFAHELKGTNIKVNSVCPGWVRTDMGGANATRSIDEGVKTIVWLATLADDGPTGGFFRDNKPIVW